MKSREILAALNTPQSRHLFIRIVGLLAGFALFWIVLVAILSLFPAWTIILLALVLGAVWQFKRWQQKRREAWIDSGCCGACGYDLRASPAVCPECGRDPGLDEPIWKKVRRNFVARRAAEASGAMPVLPLLEPSGALPVPVPAARLKNVVLHRPAVDDEPIPLEPLANEMPSLGSDPGMTKSQDPNPNQIPMTKLKIPNQSSNRG
jgi:hypothetical protein